MVLTTMATPVTNDVKIYYFHIRPVIQSQPLKFSSHGGRTVAARIIDEHIEYALSDCSKKDQFDRCRGRTIAKGRLEKKKENQTFVFNDTSLKNFHKFLYEQWNL